jgi:hypothetical protein
VDVAADGVIAPADYVMPADEATAELPWSGIYSIQPIEGMRAAYRWQVGFRVVLAILAGGGVVAVLRRGVGRGPVIAGALAALLVLETASHHLLDAPGQARDNFEAAQRLRQDVDGMFGAELRRGDRVLFLPAHNDYLVNAIAPRLGVFTYNTSFDKEVERIRRLQPTEVTTAMGLYVAQRLTRDHVCRLFRNDLVDVVVLNNFDMRWDSIDWPPDADRVARLRQPNVALGFADDHNFRVVSRHLATFVRPSGDASTSCRPTP